MTPTDNQVDFVTKLKEGLYSPSLPVRAHGGDEIGSLVVITRTLAADQTIIEDLCRWRSTNRTSFLTVFEPDLASTRNYLANFSIPDPTRVLFLILDNNGRRVGNIGLCNISEFTGELDNVIRGERTDSTSFMRHVLWTLVDWAFSELSLKSVYLNVLDQNDRAIKSYERAGFVKRFSQTLERQEINGGYRLVPSLDGRDGNLVRMELDDERLNDIRCLQEHID